VFLRHPVLLATVIDVVIRTHPASSLQGPSCLVFLRHPVLLATVIDVDIRTHPAPFLPPAFRVATQDARTDADARRRLPHCRRPDSQKPSMTIAIRLITC
jgi:hypothetical protein